MYTEHIPNCYFVIRAKIFSGAGSPYRPCLTQNNFGQVGL